MRQTKNACLIDPRHEMAPHTLFAIHHSLIRCLVQNPCYHNYGLVFSTVA